MEPPHACGFRPIIFSRKRWFRAASSCNFNPAYLYVGLYKNFQSNIYIRRKQQFFFQSACYYFYSSSLLQVGQVAS